MLQQLLITTPKGAAGASFNQTSKVYHMLKSTFDLDPSADHLPKSRTLNNTLVFQFTHSYTFFTMASTVPPGMQPPGISNNAASAGGLKRKLEDTQSSASNININTNPSSSMDKKQRPPMPPTYMLASLVPESEVFADLLRMEQKLDWTMLRKKAEVTDALGKPVKVSDHCVGRNSGAIN